VKFTPIDVRKQEFKKVFRGFDPDEVDAFLIMVADELEALIHERSRANDELIKLRTQLRDYQNVEQTLHNTLMKATNTVEESRLNSLREAELRITEAELHAEKITEAARSELQELRHEIILLRTQKESFSRRLRHLLESQIELIEVLGMDDVSTLELEEEAVSRFMPRGRLPRPMIADSPGKSEEEPMESVTGRPIEPRIIHSNKKFDEPFLRKPPAGVNEPADKNLKDGNRVKPGDHISDQLIV
jgi:cell division initiation protein